MILEVFEEQLVTRNENITKKRIQTSYVEEFDYGHWQLDIQLPSLNLCNLICFVRQSSSISSKTKNNNKVWANRIRIDTGQLR